jgi:hypothetical protein
MGSFQVREDMQLSQAFRAAIPKAGQDHPAVAALSELANAAEPGNGWPGPASVSWDARGRVASALEAVAEDHPLAGELRGIAGSLRESVAMRAAQHTGVYAPPDAA